MRRTFLQQMRLRLLQRRSRCVLMIDPRADGIRLHLHQVRPDLPTLRPDVRHIRLDVRQVRLPVPAHPVAAFRREGWGTRLECRQEKRLPVLAAFCSYPLVLENQFRG